jgi:hypothetical protein
MINKRFSDIRKEDIEELVENSVIESKTMEYKLELPWDTVGAKKEFLADISSFANASGGDIIYGIREKKEEGNNTGEPEEIVGLADVNVDKLIGRIENIIRDGIEPRINGISIKAIEGFPKGPVLLIRIPISWLSPHMIRFKHCQRFYSRNNHGKYPMDINELRSAFTLSNSLAEKIRQFHDGRIAKIIADETPLPMLENPKIVLYILPITAFHISSNIDLKLFNKYSEYFWPLYASGMSHRYNLDGILTFTNSGAPPYRSYVQLFRNGVLEAVEASILDKSRGQEKVIPSITFGDELIKSLESYIKGLEGFGVGLPIFIMLTLIGVKDYKIPGAGWLDAVRRPTYIDRDLLQLPEVQVDSFTSPSDVILRPVFDSLWQSGGFAFCPYYDNDGRWKPKG